MDDIVIFTNDGQLSILAQYLHEIAAGIEAGDIYTVRACVDEGSLKLKANERTWSPPLGRLEVQTRL